MKPTIRNMYLYDRCFFLHWVVCQVGLQVVSWELNILSQHMQICNDIIMQKPMSHVHIDISNIVAKKPMWTNAHASAYSRSYPGRSILFHLNKLFFCRNHKLSLGPQQIQDTISLVTRSIWFFTGQGNINNFFKIGCSDYVTRNIEKQ